VDDLHTEVSRKKALSTHNEKAADSFRDRISQELRDLVQSADDFRTFQDSCHGNLADMLQQFRSARQKEAGRCPIPHRYHPLPTTIKCQSKGNEIATATTTTTTTTTTATAAAAAAATTTTTQQQQQQ